MTDFREDPRGIWLCGDARSLPQMQNGCTARVLNDALDAMNDPLNNGERKTPPTAGITRISAASGVQQGLKSGRRCRPMRSAALRSRSRRGSSMRGKQFERRRVTFSGSLRTVCHASHLSAGARGAIVDSAISIAPRCPTTCSIRVVRSRARCVEHGQSRGACEGRCIQIWRRPGVPPRRD